MAQVFSPNLAQNFPFRVQIGLTYPRSPWGPLSGATDLARHTPIVAVSDQSSAKLPLPCPSTLASRAGKVWGLAVNSFLKPP